mmetsp:Transcript_1700/g.7569  ORF Transcript_1700/g.7569 Transcript_1700/m.7569 type:complete len:219 (-) Transcript_1700:2507-3163(-)
MGTAGNTPRAIASSRWPPSSRSASSTSGTRASTSKTATRSTARWTTQDSTRGSTTPSSPRSSGSIERSEPKTTRAQPPRSSSYAKAPRTSRGSHRATSSSSARGSGTHAPSCSATATSTPSWTCRAITNPNARKKSAASDDCTTNWKDTGRIRTRTKPWTRPSAAAGHRLSHHRLLGVPPRRTARRAGTGAVRRRPKEKTGKINARASRLRKACPRWR